MQFIVDAVQNQAVSLAGHSYGCRVVQRLLEHGSGEQKAPIMVEIMSSIADLIKDTFANYVVQHVVEHGTLAERSFIIEFVRADVCQLSQHKFASNVVERCLQHGSVTEREVLIEILIGDNCSSSPLNDLVRDSFGNYVVQRILDVARPSQRERVVNILKLQVPIIKKYSYGKHIIARLGEDALASAPSHGHGVASGPSQISAAQAPVSAIPGRHPVQGYQQF
jgi:pumilio RNA-binding family